MSTSAHLIPVIRQALGPRWEYTIDGDHLYVQHRDGTATYRPPRRPPAWADLLDTLETAFADQGVPRAPCLPLRWGRDTELTISAVQALDPLLNDGQPVTHREGYLPQPVVRFTGQRDATGNLRDGYLTSFVNISRVQPITTLIEYGTVLDEWITVLSQLGMHAKHIEIYGSLATWHRSEVAGVTLRIRHAGWALGDIVLLWNAANPNRMAVDLGTALERIAWCLTRKPWPGLIFDHWPDVAPAKVLDALRTATLLLGNGITPSPRGAGSITRRVLTSVPVDTSPLGYSNIIRTCHAYWNSVATLPSPWHDVTHVVEAELESRPRCHRHA